jgi:hypothetical protein
MSADAAARFGYGRAIWRFAALYRSTWQHTVKDLGSENGIRKTSVERTGSAWEKHNSEIASTQTTCCERNNKRNNADYKSGHYGPVYESCALF